MANGSSAITLTNLYDNVDVLWEKNDKAYVAEIKCRDHHHTQYKTAILEKGKYDALQQFEREQYYVMLYDDGVGYMWRINDLKPKWETKYLPKTRYGSKDLVKKEITYLSFDDAIKIIINNDVTIM
jgi:hypothetical protein